MIKNEKHTEDERKEALHKRLRHIEDMKEQHYEEYEEKKQEKRQKDQAKAQAKKRAEGQAKKRAEAQAKKRAEARALARRRKHMEPHQVCTTLSVKDTFSSNRKVYPGFTGQYSISIGGKARRIAGRYIYEQMSYSCAKKGTTACMTNPSAHYGGADQPARFLFFDAMQSSWLIGKKVGGENFDLKGFDTHDGSPDDITYSHIVNVDDRGGVQRMPSGWYYSGKNHDLILAPNVTLTCLRGVAFVDLQAHAGSLPSSYHTPIPPTSSSGDSDPAAESIRTFAAFAAVVVVVLVFLGRHKRHMQTASFDEYSYDPILSAASTASSNVGGGYGATGNISTDVNPDQDIEDSSVAYKELEDIEDSK